MGPLELDKWEDGQMENWEICLQIAVRWVHVIATMFWIGTTLYLSRMGRNIVPDDSEEAMGTILGIHGGAVWQYRKLLRLPEGKKGYQQIHWFKWESLVSWLSGILLFIHVYIMGGLMYGDAVTQNQAIAIGLTAIVLGVAYYRILWGAIPPGSKHETLGVLASYVAIMGFVYVLGKYIPARAVWMHLAVTFGTIMAIQNVWLTILPSQTQILAVMERGGVRDEGLAMRAFRCTKHNTYMMVPLVLMMMSNHYPATLYGTDHDWIVIGVAVLVGWGGAHLLRTKL